ncbi:MAG: peptide ABC transporter substrate-binding protein [Thermomicrobiales bacterium]
MADETRTDESSKVESQSIGVQRLMRLQQELGRRSFLGGAAGLTAAAILAACGGTTPTATSAPASAAPPATEIPTRAPVAPVAPSAAASAAASTAASAAASTAALPADAAAADQQVWVVNTGQEVKVMDFYEAVYARPTIADLFSEPLVRLSKEYAVIPGAATSWEGSSDGKTWTFKLDPKLMWSDGNPVTADDYVATFQYGADPKHAWDFTWFFQGVIAGWDDAIGGKIPLDQLGVKKGADANTLIFTTQVPAPYLPAMLLYSMPLSKAALAKSGPLYNTKPETAVSSGPFILTKWAKDQQIVFERNAKYTGNLKPQITKIIQKVAAPATNFTAYQNGEIDYMQGLAPAEVKLVQDSADLSKEVYSSVGDFRTFYLFFDVTKPPFDNIKVRQAFSHVVDRDQIQKSILGPGGTQAYSWLAPGFPASNREGLKDIQKYDVAAAKQLLADAGFANGANFPKQTLWLRNESALNQAVATSIASSIKTNLGIDVEVSNKDTKLFMDSLTAKPTQILFGFVSYGMDFLDPYNMLSVWFSGGRHSWANKDFDTKAKEAATFLGPTEQRLKMFQDAEKILVSDVPGVFVYHETPLQLFKPWVKGEALEPDKLGNKSLHWPGYSTTTTAPNGLYMTKDVSKRKS